MKNSIENLNSIENQQALSSSYSVLVIDDCPETLVLQKILLGTEGYDVHTAESGHQALQLLDEIKIPNLILLDMNIGDMTGIELLNLIETNNPKVIEQVPVVFLSGMSEIPESKAVGFIRKPTDTDKLLADVRKFIELGHRPPFK